MDCNICKNNTSIFSRVKILNKYDVKYFYCDYCGFIQTEEPYWLEEAYKEPIKYFCKLLSTKYNGDILNVKLKVIKRGC